MRVMGTLIVTMTAVAAATAVFATPAHATAGSQCVRMQGLTEADLCVSIEPMGASVQPGAAATFAVTVSVENGLTADVTVALSTQPSGRATYTSGCPDGDGSASCWIATMNVLGSASSVQMVAQVPASAAGTSVSLSATASVPTVLPWTPPAARAAVSVAAPTPTRSPAPSPSPTAKPAKTTPAPSATRQPSTRHTPAPASGSRTTAPASVEADPTLPPIPLPTLAEPTLAGPSSTVVSPGNASGLFPTISATPSPSPSAPGATTGEVSAEATGFAVPLAPAGLVVAVVIALGGAGLAGRQFYHRRRDGKP
jgi:hypothetical protein